VNGVAGGGSATGTISAAGLYTPPATIPSPNTLTITAVTQATPVVSASQTESILNPIPVVSSAQATETAIGGTSYSLDLMGTGFISTSQLQVGEATLPLTLVSSTELRSSGTITVAAGATTVAVVVTNPDSGHYNGKCYGIGGEPEGCPAGGGAVAGPGDIWADVE
jgi:hypothetical protein